MACEVQISPKSRLQVAHPPSPHDFILFGLHERNCRFVVQKHATSVEALIRVRPRTVNARGLVRTCFERW